MTDLASIPADIVVTNAKDLPEALILAGLRFPFNVAVGVNMSNREDGDKSDVYNALYNAAQEGIITTDADPLSALTDGVPSGHTLIGGQDALGTILEDSL